MSHRIDYSPPGDVWREAMSFHERNAKNFNSLSEKFYSLRVSPPDVFQQSPPEPMDLDPPAEPLTTFSNTFQCFPKLPTEIRLLVWKFARPDPQLVRLKLKKDQPEESLFNVLRFYSTAPIPGIVHTSYEAREYAMKKWYTAWTPIPGARLVPYFFNPKIDVLHIGCGKTLQSNPLSCKECRRVSLYISGQPEEVIFAERLMYQWTGFNYIFRYIAMNFPSATQVVFLSERSLPPERGALLSDYVKSTVPFPNQDQYTFYEHYRNAQKRQWLFNFTKKEDFKLKYIFGVEPKYRPWQLRRKRQDECLDIADIVLGKVLKRRRGLDTIEVVSKVADGYRSPPWTVQVHT